jgi:hypothetical protein
LSKELRKEKIQVIFSLILVYVATIDFKIVFQEIWDFKLTFAGWKTSTLLPAKKHVNQTQEKYPSPSCEITLLESKCLGQQTVASQICPNTE